MPYSDCYRRSIACSRRGSRCKATARLLPCKIPADNKKQAVSTACFFGGDAGFVANIVCVIKERKCLHFKAECQPGYRGSHGDAVLRFFKIAINPRIDDIEKQVEQEVQLVSRLCANTYFDTICVHPIKSAYTLSKFAYSLLKMRTVKCTDKLKFMVAKQILDWGTQILLSTRLPEIQIFCTAPLVQSLFHHFHEP